MSGFATTCDSIPASVYDRALAAAYQWMETEVTTTLKPTYYLDELHDYDLDDYTKWAYLHLYHNPIIAVERVRAVYPTGQDIMAFPKEWYRTYKASGELQLVPSSGSISQVLIGRGGTFLPLVYSGLIPRLPQLWHIDYSAGFTHIPEDMNELVGKKAAIEVLGIVSDILYPPGAASISLGIDSVSQSIGLTRGKLLFSGRIDQYWQDIKSQLTQIKMRHSAIRFTVG